MRYPWIMMLVVAAVLGLSTLGARAAQEDNVFFRDAFAGANGKALDERPADGGAAWVKHPFTKDANKAVLDGKGNVSALQAPSAMYVASVEPPSADYAVSADVIRADGTGAHTGVIGRADAGKPEWISATVVQDRVALYRGDGNGSFARLAEVAVKDFGPGTYRITLTLAGTKADLALQRASDKQWLTSAGTFGAEQVVAATAAVPEPTSPGKAGVWASRSNATAGALVANFAAGNVEPGAQSQYNDEASTATKDTPITDAGIVRSPYNWLVNDDGSATTNNPGAYVRARFTGTSAALVIDTTANASLEPTNYPAIAFRVDNAPWQRQQLAANDSVIPMAKGLEAGSHEVEVVLVGMWWQSARWEGARPAATLTVFGLRLDESGALEPLEPRPNLALIFGDSNSEGYEVLHYGPSVATQDAGQATPMLLGRALGPE